MWEEQYKDDRGEWRVSQFDSTGKIYWNDEWSHTRYRIVKEIKGRDVVVENGHADWCTGCEKEKNL